MARARKLKPGFMFTLAYDILNKKKDFKIAYYQISKEVSTM